MTSQPVRPYPYIYCRHKLKTKSDQLNHIKCYAVPGQDMCPCAVDCRRLDKTNIFARQRNSTVAHYVIGFMFFAPCIVI